MSPRITAIEPQRKDPQRVSIFVDGEFSAGLSREIAAGLRVDQQIDPEELQALAHQDETIRAYRLSIIYLGSRARSRMEVARRLAQAGYSAEATEAALQRLEEQDLVDDARLAREWVEYRLREKQIGVDRLRMELGRKGIGRELVAAALEGREEEQESALKEFARRRLERMQTEPRADARRRLSQLLRQRGFDWDSIRATVDELLPG